jgi:hypothetical protein
VENFEQSPKMHKFNESLRQIIRVPKEDLNEILAKEKAATADKPKRGPKRSDGKVRQVSQI